MRELKVTVLIDNMVNSRGLMAEHGLSFYIQKDSKKFIFDTGQGLGLTHNCRQLGVDLDKVTSVVLSHGHYDHTGGIEALLQMNPELTFRGHPDVLKRKYKEQNEEFIEIGMPEEVKGKLSENIIFNHHIEEIEEDIFLTGELPPSQPGDRPGSFKVWDNGYTQDTFRDEQALYIKTPRGLVVFSGCSHNGIMETLHHIKKISGEKIYTVMGGFHLEKLGKQEITKIAGEMQQMKIDFLGLCHCTGINAFCYFKQKFKEQVFYCPTGAQIYLFK